MRFTKIQIVLKHTFITNIHRLLFFFISYQQVFCHQIKNVS